MIHNLIIIGSGPAGYTAAIYAGRAELKPLVFTGEVSGGQLMNTTVVENWPGAKDGVLGPELMMNMRQQAQKFGAELVDKKVSKVELVGEVKKVWVGEEEHQARVVIVATGAEPIKLNIPGEKELMGRGVAVCAVCDAPFYREKTAFVIGGGDAAIEDAMALTKFAKKVYIVHRREEFRASKIMAKRAKDNPKIEILWNTEVKEVLGESKVEGVILEGIRPLNKNNKVESRGYSPAAVINSDGGGRFEMDADGVFLAIGHKPTTKIFEGQLELDERGFIKTNMVYPEATKTNIAGVFAAGDVVDYHYQQAITASAMGCQAALDAEKWLEDKYV